MKCPRVVSPLLSDRRGASAAEIIILVAVIAVLCITSWRLFGQTLLCMARAQGSTVSQIGEDSAGAGLPEDCGDEGGGVSPPPTTSGGAAPPPDEPGDDPPAPPREKKKGS